MKLRFVLVAAVATFCNLLSPIAHAQDATFRFLATGDAPYSKSQDSMYRNLLKQSESEDFAFLMHVGDFKGGSDPCTDENFSRIRDLFKAYPKPVVFTPGDNDWTDCHTVGTDPIERLDKVRELFFRDAQTLRLEKLGAKFQSASAEPAHKKFVENYRFTKSGVLFVVAHVVGSNNNMRDKNDAAKLEFKLRSEANQAFLKESVTEAVKSNARAIAVVIHANPNFETGTNDGFNNFRATMREFLGTYRKPVVCIHGDTHYYRIDQPLKDEKKSTYMNFTRMEVFGSPIVAGVVVTVNPDDPQVFSYRPYYLQTIKN